MSHLRSSQSDSEIAVPKAGETFVGEDGVVSVVLDDGVDAEYDPTEEEIEEFATWMGMKLPEDNEFLYIAREGLKAPLPKDWKPCRTNEDEIYYFNFRTGESTWNHPLDEVYCEKFLKEKKRKNEAEALRHGLKTSSVVTSAAAAAAAVSGNNKDNSNSNSSSGPISIMQTPSSSGIGGISINTLRTVPSSTPPMLAPSPSTTKGSVGASPLVLKASSVGVSSVVGSPTTIMASTSLSSPRGGIGVDGSKQRPPLGSGERRIISEAEKNLEEKIRQEREMEFKVESQRADALQQERLEDVRRSRATELRNLQEELETKLQDVRDKAASVKDTSLNKKRQELEDKWAPILAKARQEETDLQQELLRLEEDYKGRIVSEVAKAENAQKERFERLQKAIELETKGSIEKMRREAHAEFLSKRNELQKRVERELQELKEAAKKRHEAEMESVEKKYKKEMQQTSGATVGTAKPTGQVLDEALIIAEIREKEKNSIADIIRQSKEDQAAFRTTMEDTLRCLRKELCELEGPINISVNVSTGAPSSDDILKGVRDRLRVEETKRMHALEEERRKQLLALTLPHVEPAASRSPSPATSSSTSTTSSSPTRAITGDGGEVDTPLDTELRAMNDARLAEKAAGLHALETFLRETLEQEFALAAAPTAERVRAAAAGAVAVFGRTTDLRRRLSALRAVDAAEWECRRHYTTERLTRTAEVEAEMQQYAQQQRCEVETQEKARADAAEAQMRREAERRAYAVAQERVAVAEAEAARQFEQQREEAQHEEEQRKVQEANRVALEVLQASLDSITKRYAVQEQKLQKKIDFIKEEIAKIKEMPAASKHVLVYHYQQLPEQEQQEQCHQPAGSLFPDASNTTTLQLSTMNSIHSSPFSSEALRFLNKQRQELSVRRGALLAAREEWHNDVRNASRAPSPVSHGDQVGETLEGGAVNAQLLTLVGALGNRLEHLTGHIAKERTTYNLLPRHHHNQHDHEHHRDKHRYSPPIEEHRNSHKQSHPNRHELYEDTEGKGGKGRIKVSPQKKHLRRESPQKEQLPGDMMQKWSQILLDLAAPPPNHSKLSTSIQRYVSEQ